VLGEMKKVLLEKQEIKVDIIGILLG